MAEPIEETEAVDDVSGSKGGGWGRTVLLPVGLLLLLVSILGNLYQASRLQAMHRAASRSSLERSMLTDLRDDLAVELTESRVSLLAAEDRLGRVGAGLAALNEQVAALAALANPDAAKSADVAAKSADVAAKESDAPAPEPEIEAADAPADEPATALEPEPAPIEIEQQATAAPQEPSVDAAPRKWSVDAPRNWSVDAAPQAGSPDAAPRFRDEDPSPHRWLNPSE